MTVVRKSRKPRLKQSYDEQGKLQAIEVYRYYCQNSVCEKGSFTHFPSELVPYSRYPPPARLLAVQIYVWGIEYISVHGTNPWRDRGNRLSLGEWLERATVAGGCLIWRRPVQWRCRGG